MKVLRCRACQGANLERFLQPVILSILSKEGSAGGYRIIKLVEGYATFADAPPDPTGVYRYLRIMAEKGLIRCDETGGERLYQITTEGRHCLKSRAETIRAYSLRLEELCEQLAL